MSESNKFTKGPWSLDESRHAGCINRLNPFRHIGMVSAYQATKEDKEENRANALLISAAPDLLEALEKMIDNEEQMEFESWLEMKSPSGDCESVTDQWKESSYYLDFIDAVNLQITAINKARGQQ